MNETKKPLLQEIVSFNKMKAVRLRSIVHITRLRKVKGPPIKLFFVALRKTKRMRTLQFLTTFKKDIRDL